MTPHNWRDDQCTVAQRQEIERRAREKGMKFRECIQIACKITGRTITDTGQLTKGEASDVIEEIADD